VRTQLPKYDYNFSIGLNVKGGRDETEATLTKEVGAWFDRTGVFYEDVFFKDVQKLVANFQQKNPNPKRISKGSSKKNQ
jgi:hypothetical protein